MAKILCVDDDIALLELLVAMLKMMGFETRLTSEGEKCISLLKDGDFHPNIILLDIMMEPWDGWQVLQCIKNEPNLCSIPVVILTGKYPTMDDVNRFSSLIDGYLMKPFAFERIEQEIKMQQFANIMKDEKNIMAYRPFNINVLHEEEKRFNSIVLQLKEYIH